MQNIGTEEPLLTPEIHRAWQSPGPETSAPSVALTASSIFPPHELTWASAVADYDV